jgi:ribosomal protein S18 acetylase RimI-like enzyme
MELKLATGVPDPQTLQDAVAVYHAAFSQPPYGETAEAARGFADRVHRYAAEREGCRLVTARDDTGQMTAIGLAVLARPGNWWRDQAAAAIPGPLAGRWIGDLCLEVVHLAVIPAAQGRGNGRLVHDVLIAGRPAPTAILSVHPEAGAAQRLYQGRGWTTLTADFRTQPAQPRYRLMGRQL